MSIQLDHMLIPVRNRLASAEMLASLLGVAWAESGVGPFSPVYVSDGLTLDFDEADEDYPVQHYCFRVSDEEFDAILSRIRAFGLDYRSTPHGPMDTTVNAQHGGRIVTGTGLTSTSGKCLPSAMRASPNHRNSRVFFATANRQLN